MFTLRLLVSLLPQAVANSAGGHCLLQAQKKSTSKIPYQVASSCPAELVQLSVTSADASAQDAAHFNRVVLADYPSTGSTWLRTLLNEVCTGKDGQCGPPGCAIYDHDAHCEVASNTHCPCAWKQDNGAMLVKTHFPSQELFNGKSLSDWQYNASMRFDKLVWLVRHPVATVKSNHERWKGPKDLLADNVLCWGHWWKRASDGMDADKVMILRYEDLCTDTAVQVLRVLHFLGGRYASVTRDMVERIIQAKPSLQCIHAQNLEDMAKPKDWMDDVVMQTLSPLLGHWGYEN